MLSPVAGARFRDEVLARGGSRPALESFIAFRGRAPQLDALLRHNGMVVPACTEEAPWPAAPVVAAVALAAMAALAAIAGPGVCGQRRSTVYRYIDPDGRVVYSRPQPPANAKDVEAKRLTPNYIEIDRAPARRRSRRRSATR